MNNTQILEQALADGTIKEIPEDELLQAKLAAVIKSKQDKQDRKAGDLGEQKDLDDDELFYRRMIEESVEKGLPVPHEIEGDPPQLPLDLTDLSNKEVRFQHGAFNACAARAGWLYAFEEAGEDAAGQIADYHEDNYITSLGEERKDFGGKSKTQALLKAEAQRANPDIVKWRKRQRQHANKANKYKRLLESYTNNCERLSREWTMRMNEREHSK